MKHCKNCGHCHLDMVSQYVQGLIVFKCDRTGGVIDDPFWNKCEYYKKDCYDNSNFRKWFIDRMHL